MSSVTTFYIASRLNPVGNDLLIISLSDSTETSRHPRNWWQLEDTRKEDFGLPGIVWKEGNQYTLE